tara:strand:+ start:794 stop:1321 length:528 start_codon:yes stop_codon:yes gene_type:complete
MEEESNFLKIQTQTFRFTPSQPVKHEDVSILAGGFKDGEYSLVVNENPKSTLIIDKFGSIIVHNISRHEVAKLVTQRFLLSIGMSDEGLKSENGEMLAEFSLGKAVLLELANERFNDINLDNNINALRIDAKRHECRIILFSNGKGIVLGQKSRKVIELAVSYWKNLLEEEGTLA